MIPMKTGDQVKTDRRDSAMLARLHRAGKLTVWMPDVALELSRILGDRADQAAWLSVG